jgi:hypothetical protein
MAKAQEFKICAHFMKGFKAIEYFIGETFSNLIIY